MCGVCVCVCGECVCWVVVRVFGVLVYVCDLFVVCVCGVVCVRVVCVCVWV